MTGIDNVDETYTRITNGIRDATGCYHVRAKLQELLNVKKTRAYLLAHQMNENGLIDIIGGGAGKKYKLKW